MFLNKLVKYLLILEFSIEIDYSFDKLVFEFIKNKKYLLIIINNLFIPYSSYNYSARANTPINTVNI